MPQIVANLRESQSNTMTNVSLNIEIIDQSHSTPTGTRSIREIEITIFDLKMMVRSCLEFLFWNSVC